MTVLVGAVEIIAFTVVAYLIGRLGMSLVGLSVDALTRPACIVLGAAAMAAQLWIYGVLHIPWWSALLLGPWMALAIALRSTVVAAARRDAAALRDFAGGLRQLDPLTAGIGAFTIATLIYYLLNLVAQPLVAWDAIAMWLYKAKVFYGLSSVNLSQIPVVPAWDRHLDYPPLVPLLVDSFWVVLGRADENLGKTFGFLFLFAALWSAAALLFPVLGRSLTVLVVFILAAMPTLEGWFGVSLLMGYADYVVAALMMIAVAFLYRSVRLGRDQDSALAVVLAALAALTKNEGIPLLVIVLAVTATGFLKAWIRDRPPVDARLVAVVSVSLLPVAAWEIYVRLHGFNNDLVALRHPSLGELPSRARTIVSFYFHLMNRQNDYPWIASAWVGTALIAVAFRNQRLLLLLAVVSAQIFFYGLALLMTPYDIAWQLGTAGDRLALQVMPSVVLLLGIAIASPTRTNERGKDVARATGEKLAPADMTVNDSERELAPKPA